MESGVTADGNIVWTGPAVCPGCHQPAVFGNGETAVRAGRTTWKANGDLVEHVEDWWHESCWEQRQP